MKLLKIFTPFFILFFVAFTSSTKGQSTGSTKYDTWSATVSGGSMLFYGDLRQFDFFPVSKHYVKEHYHSITEDLTERKWGGGLSVSKYLSPYFALQAQYQRGDLEGMKTRSDAYFKANFNEYGVNGIINFGNLFFPYIDNHKITVYALLGYSWIDFKTEEFSISKNTLVDSWGYGHDRTREVCIPIGLGGKYRLSKHFDVTLESQLVNVNTDKLDAHIKTLSAKDKYGYTSLQVTYQIGRNEKVLEWTTIREFENRANNVPLFVAIDKKIDSLKNKLNNVDAKVADLDKKLNDHINQPPATNVAQNNNPDNKIKNEELAPPLVAMNKKIDSLNNQINNRLPLQESKELAPLFVAVNKKIDSLKNGNHNGPETNKDDYNALMSVIDKKIDSLSNNLNNHTNPTPQAVDLGPFFADINKKLDILNNKLNTPVNSTVASNNNPNVGQNNTGGVTYPINNSKVNPTMPLNNDPNVVQNNTGAVTNPIYNSQGTSTNNSKTSDITPNIVVMNKKMDSLNIKLKMNVPAQEAKDIAPLFVRVNGKMDSLNNRNRMNPATKTDEVTPVISSINKSVDSLSNRLNDHSKPAPKTADLDAFFADINKRLDLVNKRLDANQSTTQTANNSSVQNNNDNRSNSTINIQGTTIPTTLTADMKPQFSIFFAVNLTYIDPLNEEKVAEAARMLNDDPNLTFDIVGYADKTGNTIYNDGLSLRRAQAVKNDLVNSYGISAGRLNVTGKGDKYPLSPDIYSVNRRVDFIMQKKK